MDWGPVAEEIVDALRTGSCSVARAAQSAEGSLIRFATADPEGDRQALQAGLLEAGRREAGGLGAAVGAVAVALDVATRSAGDAPVAIAYKILTADEAAALRRNGVFPGSAVDFEDGFIHLSAAAQVAETMRRYFAGQDGLVVAAIDLARFGDAVRWEASRGGQLFPHLYAALPIEAVIGWEPARQA